MEKKNIDEEVSLTDLICEIMGDRNLKDEIPKYRIGTEPFWGVGSDNDIFKVHPEAIKAIPYKPRCM